MQRHILSRSVLFALGTAFVAAPPASAQIAHRWSFGGTGTAIIDSVGGADGVALNGAELDGSGALRFDGVDDYVALPAGLASAREVQTFELWFEWSGGSSNQRVFDFGDNNGTQGLTYFVLTPRASNGNAGVYMQTVLGGGSKKVYTQAPLTVGALTHIALIYDSPGDRMRIYRDGVFQNELTLLENLSQLRDVNGWIGRSNWSSDPWFRGAVTELRIYGYGLTDLEVAASYGAGPDSLGTVGINYCQPATPNASGLAAAIGATGSRVVALNGLVLEASNLPQSSFTIFLTSRTQGYVPNPGGGLGHLCIVGAIGRYVGPGQIQNSGTAGAVSLALDLTRHPTPSGLVAVSPGETWNFQAWYRDSAGGAATSNFSDALEVTFE